MPTVCVEKRFGKCIIILCLTIFFAGLVVPVSSQCPIVRPPAPGEGEAEGEIPGGEITPGEGEGEAPGGEGEGEPPIAGGTVVNTGAEIDDASPLAISDSLVAFNVVESQIGLIGEDLNGDGDRTDTIVRFYDAVADQVVETRAETSSAPQVSGDLIAFITNESVVGQLGVDLNGDGDRTDDILRVFKRTGSTVINSRAEVSGGVFAVSRFPSNLVAFVTHESDIGINGIDLNGDGDFDDDVLRVYNAATNVVINTGAEITGSPKVFGNFVAFNTLESTVGIAGIRLNADADLDDTVLRIYDATADRVINTGAEITGDPVVSWVEGNVVAFTTIESQAGTIGVDLNADGDFNDTVVRYYDVSSGSVHSTRFEALGRPVVAGNIVAAKSFEGTAGIGGLDLNHDGDKIDNVIRFFNTTSAAPFSIAPDITGDPVQPAFSGDIIAFRVAENVIGTIGLDLNGDGDKNDIVLRFFDASRSGFSTTSAEISGDPVLASGNIIAFPTNEADVRAGGADLNGDGDRTDVVVRFYDTSTGKLFTSGAEIAGNRLALSSFIALTTLESNVGPAGQDLNGDGDRTDTIVRIVRFE